ncbi:MAG: succinate dehydrogenase assembly factor 2 [Proteobacteria bacterium]|nr:succinate dehydrogenase assembly factor 2 [Pseudomonadota bacterium]
MIPADLKHIYWRSRRGLTELELKLVPFVRDCFHDLSSAEQALYEQLLDWEDVDLYDLLQGRITAQDPMAAKLVEKIIAYDGIL